MSIERRVMWLEGAFLRPQHFQQQDRRIAAGLAERGATGQAFHWGFSQLEIDEAALRQGTVALRRCRGAFQDGEVFGWPGEIAELPSVRPPRTCTNQIVYLLVPQTGQGGRLGAARGAPGASVGSRYVIEHTTLDDALNPDSPAEAVETGMLNARLSIGTDGHEGYLALPVARVREVTDDNAVLLDNDFIPTVVHARAAPALGGLIAEIASLLGARADTLSGGGALTETSGNAALIKLMMLQLTNAKGAVFSQMATANALHPEVLYRECLELAGALCTFSAPRSNRAPAFPAYDHDDITPCFAAVMAVIRDVLAEVMTSNIFPIPLSPWERIGFHATVAPADLLPDGQFVIAARDLRDEDAFRDAFPRQTTIASSAQIVDYITGMDRGAGLRPLSNRPEGLPPMDGWTFFELQHKEPCWSDIAASRTIAIYVGDAAFKDLKLELWGIRSRK